MAQGLLANVLMQFLYLKAKISVGPMLNYISQCCGYLEFMIETIKKTKHKLCRISSKVCVKIFNNLQMKNVLLR